MQKVIRILQLRIFGDEGDGLTSSQEVSHASPFPLPAGERARRTAVTSGLTCSVPFMRSGPVGLLVRTLVASSRWYSPARRLTWDVSPLCSERISLYTASGRNTSSRLSGDSGWESGLLEMGLDSRNAQGKLNPVYHFPLTKKMYETLLGNKKLISKIVMEPEDYAGQMYPLNLYTKWNRNNYGPIWIPAKGATITLTEDNLPIYERCIVAYEGNKLEVKPDGIYINGEKTNEYTFKMDYYWMMGDNRHNSADSRYWGFVPEDHVVGKPIVCLLYTSPSPRD